MNKWERVRYIIDAKKCIDSVLYISDNFDQLSNIDLNHLVKLRKNEFYLNISFVLDDCFKCKKELCERYDFVNKVYYNRDKNIAHKDINYIAESYKSIIDIAKELTNVLTETYKLIKEFLPFFTINIIHYDRDLFRFVNNVSVKKEKEIMGKSFPGYDFTVLELNNLKENLKDLDQLKERKFINKKDFSLLLSAGINELEGLQNRQDFCIKSNLLYDLNIWAEPNMNEIYKFEKLRKEKFCDEFGNLIYENIKLNPERYDEIKKECLNDYTK